MPVDELAWAGDVLRADVFLAAVRQNPINAALLDRLPKLGLPDCWLVAGCLFQTIWNVHTGRPPGENINDYDVFYFDGADLSFAAEDMVIKRVAAALTDLDVVIEVKNQARMHLWYRQRFGLDYPQLTGSKDAIGRFLVVATCVGVQVSEGHAAVTAPAIYAPFGLDELYAGILRLNPALNNPGRFLEKASSYKRRWPWLQITSGSAEIGAEPPP
jgi:uncharacterized protein